MQKTVFQNITLVVSAINNTATVMQMYKITLQFIVLNVENQHITQVSNTSVASISQQELHHAEQSYSRQSKYTTCFTTQ